MDISQQIGVLFSELERIFRTNTVVGEPITAGNVTVIPITSISFGAGNAAAGSQKGKEGDNSGGGAGAGGKITPVAVIVIRDDEVSVLPLGHKNSMESVMAQLPGIISQFKAGRKEHPSS
ncbi:MAG TPA: spore germination protein GerW family protein [Syntrophomonas sp.]|nr:spore germination protein GerW family protein [Syntrophomonas sp.]